VRAILAEYAELRKRIDSLFVAEYTEKFVAIRASSELNAKNITEVERKLAEINHSQDFDGRIERATAQINRKRSEISQIERDIEKGEREVARMGQSIPSMSNLDDLNRRRLSLTQNLAVR
jgi:septal ring factor EnvC (AmiA/AmiB activator)